MNTNVKPRQKQRNYIVILSMILLIIILSMCYKVFSDSFVNFDIELTYHIQQRLTKNELLNNILLSFNYGNNLGITCLMIIIVFNFTNVYKSFILFSMISLCYYLSILMKFFFQSSTPYLDKENGLYISKTIKIYFCCLGYGNPSTHTFAIVPFYLSLWKIYQISKPEVNKSFKIFLFIIDILLILCLCTSTLISSSNYFSQVLFSIICGLAIYFLIFYGLNPDLQSGEELYQIIKYKLYFYFFIYFFLFGILFIVYINLLKSESNIKETLEGCKAYNSDKIAFFKNEKGKYYYINGSFSLIGVFIGNFFCICGIKFELFVFFKSHRNNWIDFNFSQDKFNDDDKLQIPISITEDAKWNNTTFCRAIMRLIILLILSSISLIPYFLIGWDEKFYIVFLVKLTLPIIIFEFCLFSIFKRFLKETSCINSTIFVTLDEKRALS